MQLVSNRDEVRKNLETLEAYRTSPKRSARDFYSKLIRKGICFLIYHEGSRVLLGPSRFIGYVDNDIKRHEADEAKDGRDTNAALEAIFGPFELNKQGDSLYRQFCA